MGLRARLFGASGGGLDPASTGLATPHTRESVNAELVRRSRERMQAMSPAALNAVLEDALYQERKRLQRAKPEPQTEQVLEDLAKGLIRGTVADQIEAGLRLVSIWGEEVHGRFDPRVYRAATRVLPRGITGLLSGRPDRLRDWELSSSSRLGVKGDLDWLRELSREATLVLVPTHVSNLDSPMIGLALYLAGLPPFTYGAGLNLFDNPLVGWWLGRLGAYTVDRTKRSLLYKEVLKDYSVRCLTSRHHSLFFPGGTRSRSHEIEPHIKKGLLGTGIVAWQEMLEAGRPDHDVYFVPLTLSFTQVLEAATLIQDHLEEAGKQRYIITDDEFAQPRQLATFARRILDLDSAAVAHFGEPIDCLGRPVARDLEERRAQSERRKGYVCDVQGKVERDEQRDRVYTDRLATALVEAWPRYAEVLSTHLVARAAWRCLQAALGTTDPFRIVQQPAHKRRVPKDALLKELAAQQGVVAQAIADGRCGGSSAVGSPEQVLDEALDRFGRYHRSGALIDAGTDLFVEDPTLCLYYQNRLTFLDRERS
jgi:glycerol-3-phosphate O-acyltransferase